VEIHNAAEDYLRTMLMLYNKHGYIRSIDVANKLGVSKPSVSYAVKRLKNDGYITVQPGAHIFLTSLGMSLASKIVERYNIINSALLELGVSPKTAEHDAALLGNNLSDESFELIRKHIASKSTLF